MPMTYVPPTGTRMVEFWQRTRNCEHAQRISVPANWDDDDIKSELEDWCSVWGHQYDYRYGWNDEKDFGNRT